MIRAIVEHGDMRDISFIEQTLHVKFHSEHPKGSDDKPNVHRTIYSSTISDSLIQASLDVNDKETQIPEGGDIAILRFENPSGMPFISRCLKISSRKFESNIKGGGVLACAHTGRRNKYADKEQMH